MDAHLLQWLNLALRWGHLITGIAWIGTSFYFIWLNFRLAPPARPEAGVNGELWAVHGGGFYRVVRYAVAPERLPPTLHWFKWEAYATWVTGFALLGLIYYVQADAYLLPPARPLLSTGAAVAVGIGSLVAAWFGYDALCRSPLARRPGGFALVGLVLVAGLAWALNQVLNPRAAYIHVGAALGTIMAGNVFRVIIPVQKAMVAALSRGEAPDPTAARAGAQRSLHNNYLTLPVLFVMVSNHYPATYGHPWGWAVLAGVALVGAATRHWFNRHHQGRRGAWLLAASVLGLLALAVATAPGRGPGPAALGPAEPAALFREARVVIVRRCAPCHSAAPTIAGLSAPAAGVALDTPAEIRAQAARIYAVAVAAETMPLGNVTGMTAEERVLLGRWIAAGAGLR
ncbi:MAG TPA: urate hydroxylase PuuD [Gemmatimonadales bacterium]|nr:urate hydroxylase PuuD [Gemmatimonadales bacterium]